MALFQKKPQVSDAMPLYSLGLQKVRMIVGLGNIGKNYTGTRHNIGFECVDTLRKTLELPEWIEKKDLKCSISIGNVGDKRIILAKPHTFMNLSGEAVQAVMHFYKIHENDLVVIHDEMDIPFGQIRTRVGGGSAGHNGIKSVTQHIGEAYGRIRIGIQAETKMDAADFVLARFSDDEQSQMPNLLKEVTSIATEYIYGEQLNAETRSFLI